MLAISGPTVFPGYVTERGRDGYVLDGRGKLVDGWLDTGDLARVDADGFVYLSGRAKDLIIRGGHNIDPAVIEDALLAHPAVAAAAAVGRPDPHAGEVPVAYVTLAAGASVGEDELRAWASARVAEPAAAPKIVTVLDTLPVTAIGKPYKLRCAPTPPAAPSSTPSVDQPAPHGRHPDRGRRAGRRDHRRPRHRPARRRDDPGPLRHHLRAHRRRSPRAMTSTQE